MVKRGRPEVLSSSKREAAATHFEARVRGDGLIGILMDQRGEERREFLQLVRQVDADVGEAAGGGSEARGSAQCVEALGYFDDALLEFRRGEKLWHVKREYFLTGQAPDTG